MPEIRSAPYGAAAVDVLRSHLAAHRAGDPLAPVTVVVPSGYAALALRRRLARAAPTAPPAAPAATAPAAGPARPAAGPDSPGPAAPAHTAPPGLANVRFLTLAGLAELLAAARLALSGRRPATPALIGHALRLALSANPGVFKAVAAHPATERALVRAYRELRACSPPALAALARQGERAADVVRLVGEARAGLARHWYDDHDVLAEALAAARASPRPPAVDEAGHVVAFCLPVAGPAERALLDALGATVIEGTADLHAPPPAESVVTAPDPDEEIRDVLRGISARLADGMPLHRMVVLYAGEDPYAAIAAQQLDAAGIPFHGPATRTLAGTVPGAALVELLRLPERGWRRDDVVAWLSSAPVLARPEVAARWDAVSRAAGVVQGADQWDERLRAYEAALVAELAARAEVDPGEPTRSWHEVEIEHAEGLRRFVASLVAATRPPRPATWQAMAAWAAGLLARFLGTDSGANSGTNSGAHPDAHPDAHSGTNPGAGRAAHAAWPPAERDALSDVLAAVGRLGALDSLGPAAPPPDRATFVRALEQELESRARTLGSFGHGIFLAPLTAAAGLDAHTVFVVGLAEGTLPGGVRDDALLPDRERRATGGELRLVGARQEDEHVALVAALAGAEERVLSWAEADTRRGRSRLPSRWLLQAATALAGSATPLSAEELCHPRHAAPAGTAAGTGIRVVPSFEAGLAAAGQPPTQADYDLALLTDWCRRGGRPHDHFLAAEERRLAAGWEAVAARRSARFTRFDGHVGARAGTGSTLAAVLSATSLEAYATCPMRYFLRQVLRLRAFEKPEEIVRLSALEKGSLVHRVLEDYLRTLLAGQPRSLERLLAIAEAAFADVERRGLTGKQLTWRYEQALIRRELHRFYADDDLTPLAAELVFGMDGHEPVEITLPDGRTLAFRGSADRVDEGPDGRLVVTDYKTGSLRDYDDLRRNLADDPVDRGRKLQLPLYALAARQRYGTDRPVAARYWFTSERGRFESIGYDVDDTVLARFTDAVGTIAGGIDSGAFPARPGEPDRQSYRNCQWCEFDKLCSQDRAREWERKRDATPLSAYVAMAEAGER